MFEGTPQQRLENWLKVLLLDRCSHNHWVALLFIIKKNNLKFLIVIQAWTYMDNETLSYSIKNPRRCPPSGFKNFLSSVSSFFLLRGCAWLTRFLELNHADSSLCLRLYHLLIFGILKKKNQRYLLHIKPHAAKKFGFMYSRERNCPASIVSDLYISTFGPPFFWQQNRQTHWGIYKSLTETWM